MTQFLPSREKSWISLMDSASSLLKNVAKYARDGRNCVINYVGGVFCYAYMEEKNTNKVLYIPISRKNSPHVHEFSSYEEMRRDPISYEEYRERLRAKKVNFLIVNIDSPAIIYNRHQEIRWAQAHPEHFRLLAGGGENATFYMYEILWDQKGI